MTEEWRNVPGYPGYRVSSFGRVMSSRKGTRVLKASAIAKGKRHLAVLLYDGTGRAGRKTELVHRLVLRAFVGEPPFPEARALHRNDVADDNRVDNLYWGSDSDNGYDRFRNSGGHTEETKRRISEATKGRTPWNKGAMTYYEA